MVFVYHSELTHRTIITFANHGKIWEMSDGEVYDHVKTLSHNSNNGEMVVAIDGNDIQLYPVSNL